jgi:hypothetical protein
MAIPNGTKFHGVAPQVPTENRGSAQLNSLRNVYTYPDDFGGTQIAFQGTFLNFGQFGGGADILGGSSVDWGVDQATAGDHFPCLIIPFACKVVGVGCQWASTVDYQTARGASDVIFTISSALLGTNVTDVTNWTNEATIATVWDGTSGDYPGFYETTDIDISAGTVIQLTGVPNAGFANSGEDVEASILLQKA